MPKADRLLPSSYHQARGANLTMAKAGDAYQDAVAAVARQLDPTARVQVGEWVEGPDGERDCDVGVYPGGGSRYVYIECKDRKRPVGIEFVDALESKRKDVKADVAVLCSNSGFTRDALRKAARVGIPALSALIEGDSRIRVQVQEEIYTRNIKITPHTTISYHWAVDRASVAAVWIDVSARDVIHDKRHVLAWVRDKCIFLAGMTARSCTIMQNTSFGGLCSSILKPLFFPRPESVSPFPARWNGVHR